MPLFIYRCSAGHETEALRPRAVSVITCSCGRDAQRQSVYSIASTVGAEADWKPVVRDGGAVRTPVAERRVYTRQYSEALEELNYAHEKTEQSVGQALPSTPIADIAMAKVKRLRKAGVTDSMDMPR